MPNFQAGRQASGSEDSVELDPDDGRQHSVTAVLVVDAEVLLCHRSPGGALFPDLWDLPGGRRQDGETLPETVARELYEQLGIAVNVSGETPSHVLVDGDIVLSIWEIWAWTGRLRNRVPHEYDRRAWFNVDELADLKLANDAHRAALLSAIAYSEQQTAFGTL